MTLAYGIALGMGWDKPMWAGFAVAMISLSTAGQSLNKGALRMLGTLVAVVAALTLLTFFAQDRWLFITALSLYVGFCAYMFTGQRHTYFWFVSAFVCMIIAIESGGQSLEAFDLAMLRAQETGLGILVYSLISVFLWPQNSRQALGEVAAGLIAVQARLFDRYLGAHKAGENADDSYADRQKEVQLVGQLDQTLENAITDTFEVWEVREHWRSYRQQASDFMVAMERWREGLKELQSLDMERLIPGLGDICDGIGQRLVATGELLAGNSPTTVSEVIPVEVDQDRARSLAHFEKAALVIAREQLDRLQTLSQDLYITMTAIQGRPIAVGTVASQQLKSQSFMVDLDRLESALRVVFALWVGFLTWVYVDPPGDALFMFMVTICTMVAVMMRFNVSLMFLPFVYGCIAAAPLYVLLLPQLSGFVQLGAVIFGVTFAIWYFLAKPAQVLTKMAAMVAFLVLMSIENQQTYSFASMANKVAMMWLGCALAVALSYVPPSLQSEKVFVRLLKRFFRHSDYLLSTQSLDWQRDRGRFWRLKQALYGQDILHIPIQLGQLAGKLDMRLFPGTTKEQVDGLVTALHSVALRIHELGETRGLPQSSVLVEALLADVRGWRLAIEGIMVQWSKSPANHPPDDLEARLARRLKQLEEQIEATLERPDAAGIEARQAANFYRVIGSYRGLSEALIGYARQADKFDWPQWQVPRF